MKKSHFPFVLLYCALFSLPQLWSREITDSGTASKVLEQQVVEDIRLIGSRILTDDECNKAIHAHARLRKYIDDLDIAIEKKNDRNADIRKKRDVLVGELSGLMKRNAEMVERKFPKNVIRAKIDFLTEVHPDQQGRFNTASALLSRVNDQTAIDLLIDYIDRRWPRYYVTTNGLVFGMRNHYPSALELARAPSRCHDLIMSRLIHFIANTDDVQKHKYCSAVLYARSGGSKKEAIERLNNAADGEKDPVKKGRLQKQVEILEKEAPDRYVLGEGGGTID